MNLAQEYYQIVSGIFEKILQKEVVNIEEAAEVITQKIREDRLIHVFGTGGHSVMGAMEVFYRAGGLACINPLFPPGVSVIDSHPNTERIIGYAEKILDFYGVKEGDILIIVNVNGINAVTIDSALEGKKRGATIIAVTSSNFSKNVPPDIPARHPSNKNLCDLGDIVIDTHVPVGDAVLQIEGLELKVASSSTLANCFVLNILMARVAEKLSEQGIKPPVWKSANIPGGDEENRAYLEKYKGRVFHLY